MFFLLIITKITFHIYVKIVSKKKKKITKLIKPIKRAIILFCCRVKSVYWYTYIDREYRETTTLRLYVVFFFFNLIITEFVQGNGTCTRYGKKRLCDRNYENIVKRSCVIVFFFWNGKTVKQGFNIVIVFLFVCK